MAVLITHENERFQVWGIHEIYVGQTVPAAVSLHVPNVGDEVVDRNVGVYFVSSIDPNPNDPIASLELRQRYSNASAFDNTSDSLVTGLSMYQPSSATRCFVDDSVTPFSVTLDERWRSFADASHGKLFFGTDTTPGSGIVISEVYNGANVLIGEDVPYTVVDTNAPTVKRPATFNTSRVMTNAQVVTMVDYNAAGDVIGTHPFLVQLSSFIRPASSSTKQLESFTLRGILIDPADENRINNPINTPVDTSTFSLRLNYSDGSNVDNIAIDGSRAVIHGLDNFNTAISGTPKSIAVSYYPGPGEPFINGGGGARPHLTRSYELANVVDDTSFSLKLFCIPEFVSTLAGFEMKWYLTNLDRDLFVDVSTAVIVSDLATGRPYDKTNYNAKQQLSVTLAMDPVLPGQYPGHVHTQRVDVTLSVPGTVDPSPWVIDYVTDGVDVYGVEEYVSASLLAGGTFNLSNQIPTFSKWIHELYVTSHPLYDLAAEHVPPTPTHAIVDYEGAIIEIPVEDWEINHLLPTGAPAFEDNKTIKVKWIVRSGGGDLVLAYTPLLVKLDL